MFRNWLLGLLIAAALSVCLSSGAFGQVPNPTHVFYVNPAAGNAWPDGEGDSWDDAFLDLVVAIAEAPDIAGPNAVIRLNVAGGTYFGQSFVIHDHDPIKIEHVGAFAIPDGMLIYGGYAGSGPNPDARDPAEWTTTLTGLIELDVPAPAVCGLPTSGDCFTFVEHPELGCDDVDCCAVVCQLLRSCCEVGWDELCADRAKRLCIDAPFEARVDSVVATVGSGSTRRLDGLTIAGGGVRPNLHTGAGAAAGGGIYMTSQDTSADVGLDIVRCVIIDNWGATGGGIALVGDPTVADCTGTGRAVRARIWNCEIVENVAGTWGGGVYARYHAQYEIVNSVIARNSSRTR